MGLNSYSCALVRPPGESYVNAIAMLPQPIDVRLAQKQHGEYVEALRETGVGVEMLAAEEPYPDACFMQDPAMIVDGIAILNRMGADSRLGETELVKGYLNARFATHAIVEPGRLEGGDVLISGKRVLVGESERTNPAGIAQLRAILEPRGVRVSSTPVGEFLHLLTAVTYVGNNVVVVHEDFAEQPELRNFTRVRVPREEAYAANTLGIGKYVIVPAGFPKTVKGLRAEGFEVLEVPMSEFYKADGGVSCLSLVW